MEFLLAIVISALLALPVGWLLTLVLPITFLVGWVIAFLVFVVGVVVVDGDWF